MCILPTCHGQGSHQGSLLIPWQRDQAGWDSVVLGPPQAWLGSAGGCCCVHYAVLDTTSDLLEETILLLFRGKLLAVLNIHTVLWASEVKAWHNLSSLPLCYFFTSIHLLQLCLSMFLLALIWRIFQSSNFEVYNSSLNSCVL